MGEITTILYTSYSVYIPSTQMFFLDLESQKFFSGKFGEFRVPKGLVVPQCTIWAFDSVEVIKFVLHLDHRW